MILKTIIPCKELQPYIGRIWAFESKTGIPDNDLKIIAPNGKIKLIIQYNNNLKSTIGNKIKNTQENSLIVIGQSTIPAIIESKTEVGTIGIEFKPFSVYKFFNFPLNEITNQVIDISDIVGHDRYKLQEKIMDVMKVEEKIKIVEKFLLNQLNLLERNNYIIEYAINTILLSNGLLRINELCKNLGYTKRHVDRIFHEFLGIGPKEFTCITRFQTFYKNFHSAENFKITDLYDSYYDQSHFIKEFSRFTGYSPGEYLKKKNNFGRIFLQS
jgi:AraC-like DNA-binding protein